MRDIALCVADVVHRGRKTVCGSRRRVSTLHLWAALSVPRGVALPGQTPIFVRTPRQYILACTTAQLHCEGAQQECFSSTSSDMEKRKSKRAGREKTSAGGRTG